MDTCAAPAGEDLPAGRIAHLQRFSTTNGPGLRSTLFLKGCPLRCLWCHNPEMQAFGAELMVCQAQCALCGVCVQACPNGVHALEGGVHAVDRRGCRLCGRCQALCPGGAIELVGQSCTPRQALERLLRDRPFYATSGGGVTLSGGEPLAQFDFTRALLALCGQAGLHRCLDTSGWGGRAPELVGLVDLFLWDVKETDPQRHLRFTGVALEPILESLERIDALGGRVRLRCPIVPGVNDRPAHLEALGDLAQRLACVEAVDLVPYHSLGLAKARALGLEQPAYPALHAQAKAALLERLRARTRKPAAWL